MTISFKYPTVTKWQKPMNDRRRNFHRSQGNDRSWQHRYYSDDETDSKSKEWSGDTSPGQGKRMIHLTKRSTKRQRSSNLRVKEAGDHLKKNGSSDLSKDLINNVRSCIIEELYVIDYSYVKKEFWSNECE